MNKYFSDLTVYFTDQNNRPIDFMQRVVTLTFKIMQVYKTYMNTLQRSYTVLVQTINSFLYQLENKL